MRRPARRTPGVREDPTAAGPPLTSGSRHRDPRRMPKGPDSATSSPGPSAISGGRTIVLMLEREWGDRFEQMADRLVEARDRQQLKVLLFTSCHRAEGPTTLVLTLARALARRPGRTVLVDADLTGPMLSSTPGLAARRRPGRGGGGGARAGRCPDRGSRRPPLDASAPRRRLPPPRIPESPAGRARWPGSAASSTWSWSTAAPCSPG